MSEIALPKPYAPDAFSKALDNLTKRFDSEGEEVYYKDAAFDGLSEDQAGDALRYLSEIGLIEVPTQGKYIPPEHIVTWQRSIEGPAKRDAKIEAATDLEDYDVFSEIKFLLENTDDQKDLSTMAREVGGKLGIDEDDLSKMERAIEILAECGFLHLDEDQILSVPEEITDSPDHIEDEGDLSSKESGSENDIIEEQDNGGDDLSDPDTDSNQSKAINAEISISIDATEMDQDDLENKLEIIEDALSND